MITRVLRMASFVVVACLVMAPAFALSGRGSAITYQDEQDDRHLWFFTISHGDLVANHFDGTKWTWVPHGRPSRDSEQLWDPQALTYVDNAGKQRIYVFVTTNSGRLKLRYFNGFQWQWVDQGGPDLSLHTTSAITYVDPEGNRRIYLFGSSPGGHLLTNYWNGVQWLWADNGSPPGSTGHSILTDAITYLDPQGTRRIDVFCKCEVGDSQSQLVVNSWNGSSWSWFNHGGDINAVAAVTFSEASGDRRIHAFVEGPGATPQVHSRIDGSWYWINLGKPVSQPMRGIDAISYLDTAANRHMRVFVQFKERVWSREWSGSGWLNWMNHGLPSEPDTSHPVPITYWDSRVNTQRIHLFVNCSTGLCDHVFNGSTWQWQDLGSPEF